MFSRPSPSASARPLTLRDAQVVVGSFLLLTIACFGVFVGGQNPPVRRHPNQRVIPPMRKRHDMGAFLEADGLQTGVELGVLRGEYADSILKNWPSCSSYLLVDAWKPMPNYNDLANAEVSDKMYEETMRKLTTKYGAKISVCRDLTTNCARRFNPETFDFVYVDARHDRMSVLEDLNAWWPLLREGGVMAGHDFTSQDRGPQQTHQNWTINADGSVDHTGQVVRGAVIDFFNDPVAHPERYRQIYVTHFDGEWPTWVVRK